MDYSAALHAIFTYPEIASVGLEKKSGRPVRSRIDSSAGPEYSEAGRRCNDGRAGFAKAVEQE
jgi:pyruvate/2-oxoglutarate dehydrogenase complex dihydrolipoamide dehydrogenase (E3) component